MSFIPEGVISVLRNLKKQDYSDQATRQVYGLVAGGYSYNRVAYPDGAVFPCRFKGKPSPDMLPGADVVMVDADLHFGLDVVLLPNDRVKITHIHGEVVAPLVYSIVQGPFRDSLGQRAALKLAPGE
jgi:hypothetical protein